VTLEQFEARYLWRPGWSDTENMRRLALSLGQCGHPCQEIRLFVHVCQRPAGHDGDHQDFLGGVAGGALFHAWPRSERPCA